jgi:hypothetical protein
MAEIACRRCGAATPEGAKFCPGSGKSLLLLPPAPPPTTVAQPIGRSGWVQPAADQVAAVGGAQPADVPGWSATSGQPAGPALRHPRLVASLGIAAAIALIALASNDAGAPGSPLGGGAGSGTVLVTYHLTGSAKAADITYTDDAGNIQQQMSITVPMVHKSDSQRDLSNHGASRSVRRWGHGARGNDPGRLVRERTSRRWLRPAAAATPAGPCWASPTD